MADALQTPVAAKLPAMLPGAGAGLTLEQLVVDRGLATTEALVRARLVRSETGEPLDSVLTRLGLVSEQALASALAEATGLKIAAAADFPAKAIATAPLSAGFLRNARAVPRMPPWQRAAYSDISTRRSKACGATC